MESFNGKLRDELLNRQLFLSFPEARYVLDEWRENRAIEFDNTRTRTYTPLCRLRCPSNSGIWASLAS